MRDDIFQLSLFGQDEADASAEDVAGINTNHQGPLKTSGLAVKELSSVGSMPIYLHPRANRHIYLEHCCIAYELQHKRRRNLALHVSTEGVSVSAPKWVGQVEIDQFLKEKSRWMLRKLQEQREQQHKQAALKVSWEDGAVLDYLGAKLALQVVLTEGGTVLTQDTLSGSVLQVGMQGCGKDTQKCVRERVQAWMKQQAQALFEARCALFAEQMQVRPTKICLTSASTRWGRANTQGVIRLHWRLVEMPLTLIDYVVVHELAHLHEMNHSPRFWRLVEQVLPDYKERRLALKNQVMLNWGE